MEKIGFRTQNILIEIFNYMRSITIIITITRTFGLFNYNYNHNYSHFWFVQL